MERALVEGDLDPGRHLPHQRARHLDPAGRHRGVARDPQALGKDADHAVATAPKSMIGHLLGGAGAVESVATVLALHHRVVAADDQLDKLDDQIELDVATEQRKLPDGRHRGAEQLVRLRRPQRRHRLQTLTATSEHRALPRRRHDPSRTAAEAAKLPREQDPRNPVTRLHDAARPGSLELITPTTCRDARGRGTIAGGTVVAFCSDATVMGGAMGDEGCEVVVRRTSVALHEQVPIIGLWHSGGARLAEGVLSLHAVGRSSTR
jgi:hypothetical protein